MPIVYVSLSPVNCRCFCFTTSTFCLSQSAMWCSLLMCFVPKQRQLSRMFSQLSCAPTTSWQYFCYSTQDLYQTDHTHVTEMIYAHITSCIFPTLITCLDQKKATYITQKIHSSIHDSSIHDTPPPYKEYP